MRDLLKFITCGSVDDGKSTLIGHILYDSKLIYADQARALKLDSRLGSRNGKIDYSLLLDGLLAEREQGITIDVAYRYFTTDARGFIVADTPGHEQYTRNMAVGASFADLAVILVDASQGVLVQTRRHVRICSLVGIRDFVFAVNKMDLVNYDEQVFHQIQDEIDRFAFELGLRHVAVIPVSATEGDNVTTKSPNMTWYEGDTLLGYLETVEVDRGSLGAGFYLPVQRVSRPDRTFRGYQGQVEASSVKVGDEVTVLPSRERATVESILIAGASADEAHFGQPVTITLDREIDVSRGCVIEAGSNLKVATSLAATLLWMDDEPLAPGRNFFVKIGTREVSGAIAQIEHTIDVNTGERSKANKLNRNEIAVVRLSLAEAIVVDEFKNHRTMGEFILIDRISHATAACGVVERVDDSDASGPQASDSHLRTVVKGQTGVILEFPLEVFSLDEVKAIERQLIIQGRDAYLYAPSEDSHVTEVVTHLNRAGVTVLLALSPAAARALPRRNENLVIRNWHERVGTDIESVVAYIRKLMALDDVLSDAGAYI